MLLEASKHLTTMLVELIDSNAPTNAPGAASDSNMYTLMAAPTHIDSRIWRLPPAHGQQNRNTCFAAYAHVAAGLVR